MEYLMTKAFTPTYLYIKKHEITGLKYFGKTTMPYDKMIEYKGSGQRWLRHLSIHGDEHVVTVWFKLFADEQECIDYALNFSNRENIVESTEWGNLIPENGLTGFPAGLIFTDDHKKQLSQAKIGKTWEDIYGIEGSNLKREQNSKPKGPMSEQRKKNISLAKKGMNPPHNWSDESRNKVSKKFLGIKKSKGMVEKMQDLARIIKHCPHCGKSGKGPAMQRWHFKNCKNDNN